MQILITHAYTKNNKGDAAILSVLLKQLQQAFPKSIVKISTFDDVRTNPSFDGFKNISSFLYVIVFRYQNKIAKAFYAAYILAATAVWSISCRFLHWDIDFILTREVKTICEELKKSDLIVPIGGGYIRSKPGLAHTVNLLLILHPIWLALTLRKPVVLYSQSIGPFYNAVQKLMARIILNRVALIMVREDNSVQTLKDLHVKENHIVRTVDAGFLFTADGKKSAAKFFPTKFTGKTVVGITVRQWLTEKGQARYEDSFVEFLNKMQQDPKYVFIFIPQVSSPLHHDDDRQVADRIVAKLNDKRSVCNLSGDLSHYEVFTIYSKLDYLIGTRFHSVIFSLTSGVPALAIEYEYKTSGIMHDLSLSDWVIPIEDVTATALLQQFHRLTKSRSRYKTILDKKLPWYQEKAQDNVRLLRQAYEQTDTEQLTGDI